jgi:hypothetical protein
MPVAYGITWPCHACGCDLRRGPAAEYGRVPGDAFCTGCGRWWVLTFHDAADHSFTEVSLAIPQLIPGGEDEPRPEWSYRRPLPTDDVAWEAYVERCAICDARPEDRDLWEERRGLVVAKEELRHA